MADGEHNDQTAEKPGNPEFAIPDGGLSTSMPAWLLQRPNWATGDSAVMPESSEPDVAIEPALDPGPPEEAPPRELPSPDTSPIQLADVLTVDDLPAWLRAVADRAERDRVPEGSAEGEPDAPAETSIEVPVVVDESVPTLAAVATAARVDSSGRSQMVIGGVVTAVVLILLYLILSLTNVI